MKSEVQRLWQHPTRLHRIRAHHLQQQAFHADTVILELLRITQ
jgi:hypothetical protein